MCAQSDQSLLCALWIAKDPRLLHADSEDSDAQADLSLRWAHMPFCWFCHEAAQVFSTVKMLLQTFTPPINKHLNKTEKQSHDLFHNYSEVIINIHMKQSDLFTKNWPIRYHNMPEICKAKTDFRETRKKVLDKL